MTSLRGIKGKHLKRSRDNAKPSQKSQLKDYETMGLGSARPDYRRACLMAPLQSLERLHGRGAMR